MRRAILLIALTSACRSPASPGALRSDDVWTYDVSVEVRSELRIEAELTTRERQELHVTRVAERFLTDVEVADGARWTKSTTASPLCEPPRCRVRYRFSLPEAANGISDPEVLAAFGDAYAAPPSTWLMHPVHRAPMTYRIRMHGDERAFSSGVPPAPDGAASTFEARGMGLDDAPYFAFGPWRRTTATVDGKHFTVGIAPGVAAMRDSDIVEWVSTSANALASYLKRWPTAHPLLLVAPGEGDGIDGRTLGDGGGSILVTIGPEVSPAVARESWVLTHEMIHLAMPSLAPHAWLEEGMATYLEPIVRMRAGHLSAERVWGDLLRDAPQGLPRAGDEGLERTRTWERTYWGGAIFCLLADVAIRERTRNARSLDDVSRAIARGSAGVAERWSLDRFLDAGDRATGVPVLRELYETLGRAPGSIDLTGLWRRLGVSLRDGRVAFDDAAPLAGVRRGINGE